MCDETGAREEVETGRGGIGACEILSGRGEEELKVVQCWCMRTAASADKSKHNSYLTE